MVDDRDGVEQNNDFSETEVSGQLEVELWEAINHYATTCGGDPVNHVYGNGPRMQAVVAVGKIVGRLAASAAARRIFELEDALAITRNSRESNRRARLAAEHERDAYRAMTADLLASATPNERDHPSMAMQWARARELLKNGPPPIAVESLTSEEKIMAEHRERRE